MEGGGAVEFDGVAVGGGGVAFVLGPAVLGVLPGGGGHVEVALGLGKHRGGGDVGEAAVALDIGVVWYCAIRPEAVAVDGNRARLWRELRQGAVHGRDGGLEDVDFVDFGRRHHCYGPGYGLGLDDLAELHAAAFGELF